jgi:hypothetical protein
MIGHLVTAAVTWDPFIRGIVVVLIGIAVLMGSVYLVLSTNLGSRLGLMVSLGALFGWMVLMATVWWVYGIGLRGKDPTWQHKAIINDTALLADNPVIATNDIGKATETDRVDGWILLAEDDPEHGQAVAASDDILQNQSGRFKAGDYVTVAVFDKGGQRFPKVGPFDELAFFHRPRYALVKVQPVVKQNTEPGKAPPKAEPDPNASPTFVLMVRDLGNRRRPAAMIAIGSGIIFLLLCRALHRRERLVQAHLSEPVEPAPEPNRVPSTVS